MVGVLPERAQVVVIGGGIVGCSVAYHLARRGIIDVVVLEAGPRFKQTDFENDEYAMYYLLAWRDSRAAGSPDSQ